MNAKTVAFAGRCSVERIPGGDFAKSVAEESSFRSKRQRQRPSPTIGGTGGHYKTLHESDVALAECCATLVTMRSTELPTNATNDFHRIRRRK